MAKKKICWVTPDCFLDTDLNYGVMSALLKVYDIHWIVLLGLSPRFKESDFDKLCKENKNLTVEFIYFNQRARHPHTLIDYLKVRTIIKRENPDLIYFNVVPANPYITPLYLSLPKEKTIVTAHDGYVKFSSMKFAWLSKFGFDSCYNHIKHVNLFSPKQAEIFNEHFKNKNTTVIPLALKDFGKSTVEKRTDCVSFVQFGSIHADKNLQLLVRAAELAYDKGYHDFKVVVAGGCMIDWDHEIKPLIKHQDLFELHIASIPNEDIPNLFAYNYYAVFPYRQSGQSGAIKVAFNYNIPVITSNLPGFLFDVTDNYNGYVFENENVEALCDVLIKCINNPKSEYDRLVHNIEEFKSQKYSIDSITDKYLTMFKTVLYGRK